MDIWWLKFNLKLMLAEIFAVIPLLNKLPLVSDFKHAHDLIKGESDWLINITAPAISVFEDLDYLLQTPITIDEIMFENKYPLEIKSHLKRFLDTMFFLGYVSKRNDRYFLKNPITMKFTSEFKRFMKEELNDGPSGLEHVLLSITPSLIETMRSGRNLAIRRLKAIPGLFAFSDFILPFLESLRPESIAFAGGYILPLIPLLNYFSSAHFAYFEHNSLVWSKLIKLVKAVSPKDLSRLEVVEENIFVEELTSTRKRTVDLVYLSITYTLEKDISMDILVKNVSNLLSPNGVFVCDDIILFSRKSNPYLFTADEPPYYYHYLYLEPLTKTLKNTGFRKIKYLFPCKKSGIYRGCVAKR